MPDLNSVRLLYAQTATNYEAQILPAFAPLAANLADWIAACLRAQADGTLHDPFDLGAPPDPRRRVRLPDRIALDIGTGTGILARLLAPHLDHVIGVDISPDMLRVAVAGNGDSQAVRVGYAAADLHHLPVRRAGLDAVVSSFGLNHSDPRLSLRGLARVLKPGGLLIFQEWAVLDKASRLVDEVLEQHTPDELPGFDPALRDYLNTPKPWYAHLQDTEDFYEALREAGFRLVWAREGEFCRVPLPSVEAFLIYKLAWASRRLILDAMSTEARAACLDALRAALAPFADTSGAFFWSPSLFRVCAVR